MRVLVCNIDDKCGYDENGVVYVGTELGCFERFKGMNADLVLVCQGEPVSSENTKNRLRLDEHINLVDTVYVPKAQKPSEFIKCLCETYKTVDAQLKNVDAVYIRYQGFAVFTVCAAARKNRVKQLVELGVDQWAAFWNHSFFGKILALPLMLLCKLDISRAEFVHYVTEKYLQELYPTKGKTLALTNAKLQETSEEVLQKKLETIDSKKNKIVLGTAAAVYVAYKGQEYVIRALKVLKDKGYTNFEYQIAGMGDATRLMNIARECGVENQVRFMGCLPHAEVFPWLDSLDLYIQPSLQEGLPRAMIEAMSRALPCIGAKTAGIPELIDEEYIYYPKKDPQIIADRILKLSQPEELREQATKNFETAKKFSYSTIVEKRNRFYEEFLQK